MFNTPKPTSIKQHSDDGDMVIKLETIQATRLSRDGSNAEILLSDGKWIRTSTLYDNLKNWL